MAKKLDETGLVRLIEKVKSDIANSQSLPYEIEKVADYTYQMYCDTLDYDNAIKWFEETDEELTGACSSVRKGNFYGRNYDWTYDNTADFVIKTPSRNGRYATIGFGGVLGDLSAEFVESGEYSPLYKVIPFKIVDGINEKGLVCNINVVPKVSNITHTTPNIDTEYTICNRMLPRFVLDRFSTAQEAAEYIRDHVSVYNHKELREGHNYDLHMMIADKDNTYLLEFMEETIEGETVLRTVIQEMQDKAFMTNFHLSNVTFNEDGSVYTPYDKSEDTTHDPMTVNNIHKFGAGLERYNLVNSSISDITSGTAMSAMMDTIKYTNAYKDPDTTSDADKWYSEVVGNYGASGEITVSSDKTVFDTAYATMYDLYENRSRETANTWQTVHSCVYDIENRSVSVKFQEDEVIFQFEVEYQKQSDWNQNDENAPDYIKNRICYDNILRGYSNDSPGSEEYVYGDDWTLDKYEYVPIEQLLNRKLTILIVGEEITINTNSYEQTDGSYVWSAGVIPIIMALVENEEEAGIPKGLYFIKRIEETEAQYNLPETSYPKQIDDKYIKQSDWNQNDNTKSDFIKNRICYDTVLRGYSNGSQGSEEYVDGLYIYDKYECVPLEQLLNRTLTVVIEGEEHFIDLNSYTDLGGIAYGWEFDGYSVAILILEDFAGMYKGLYFAKCYDTMEIQYNLPETSHPKQIDDKYIKQSDWNQNDSTKSDYIKNRTHWTDIIEGASIWSDNINFSYYDIFSAMYSNITLVEEIPLEVGKMYYVTVGDKSFIAECKSDSSLGSNIYNLAGDNCYIQTGNFLGNTTFACVIYEEGPDVTYEVRISEVAEDIHKIDEKFLPEMSSIKHLVDGSSDGSLRSSNSVTEDDIYTIGENAVALGKDTMASGENSFAEGNGCDYEYPISFEKLENEYKYRADAYDYPFDIGVKIKYNDTILTVSSVADDPDDEWSSIIIEFEEGGPDNDFDGCVQSDAYGINSHIEGEFNTALDESAHAEGNYTVSNGYGSHSEGSFTYASGEAAHAEGFFTKAYNDSHAEGYETIASGDISHAEGYWTRASGDESHAEGCETTASGDRSHAEGSGAIASGFASHAEGWMTIANHESQHVFGEFNIEDDSTEETRERGNYVEIVGNGTESARSNARTLDWSGNEFLAGKLTVGNTQGTLNGLFGADSSKAGKIPYINSEGNVVLTNRYESAAGLTANEVSVHDHRTEFADTTKYTPLMRFKHRNDMNKFQIEFSVSTIDSTGGNLATYYARYIFYRSTIFGMYANEGKLMCIDFNTSDQSLFNYTDIVAVSEVSGSDRYTVFYKKNYHEYDYSSYCIHAMSTYSFDGLSGYVIPTYYVGELATNLKDGEVEITASDLKSYSDFTTVFPCTPMNVNDGGNSILRKLYAGPTPTQSSITGNVTYTLADISKMMSVKLTGATTTITLPEPTDMTLDFKISVQQDATGGRNLIFTAPTANVYDINNSNFAAGTANQKCLVALSWDGTDWWMSASDYFNA